ncbi:MAG: prolyl-tRNA synthetase associated domain-containing protein [Janthinobacterium lividum]
MEKVDDPAITALFGRLGLDPERVEHPPVHTVEEALPHWVGLPGEPTKNLFLKDGKLLFLVTLRAETRADMKALAPLLGAKRLSFASPERLMEHLGTSPGAVGFLSLVKDEARAVHFAVERALWDAPRITAHPLRNTATVSLTQDQFRAVLADLGITPILLDL